MLPISLSYPEHACQNTRADSTIVDAQNWKLLDPELTDGGIQQCQDLERHLKAVPLASYVELIISSPMRRALQTTLIGLRWLVESGVPVHIDPMWQGVCTLTVAFWNVN